MPTAKGILKISMDRSIGKSNAHAKNIPIYFTFFCTFSDRFEQIPFDIQFN